MISKLMKYAALSGVLLAAAGFMALHASSTIITFSVDEATNIANGTFNPPPPAGTGTDQVYARGTFNGWGAYLPLAQMGSTTIYTNSVNDTNDINGGNLSYIYHDTQNGDEGPADWANRTAYLPTNSGANLILPTVYFNDQGPATSANVTFQVDMSEEIELGHFHPESGDTVVIAGSFQGWNPGAGAPWVLTNNPGIIVTNYNFNPPVVESNVYTTTVAITANARYSGNATVNCAEDFKYVEMPAGNWENPAFPNSDSGGNRFFAEGDQTLRLVSFSDTPYTPLAHVTLNVDMSGVIASDPNYVPNSVVVWGTFNNWANGVNLTNNPSAANTNIFSTLLTMGEGASVLYQVRYTNALLQNFVYDFTDDQVYNNNARRTVTLPVTATLLTTNLPVFSFNDLTVDDYLLANTPVLFSVDMNGAVGTDSHSFNPAGGDAVYVNGPFANSGNYPQSWYPWSGGLNPTPAPPGFQLFQQGSSTIYTNTIIIPAGSPIALPYQYGIDPGGVNGGPLENEAASGNTHYRVVRSSAVSPYVLPTDTFGVMYHEPIFSTGNIGGVGSPADGNLTIGAPASGKIPVSWLGRPGAHLQYATALTGSQWQDVPGTDGTNLVSGYFSTNGFVSVTNWPAGNNTYFRLIKQ